MGKKIDPALAARRNKVGGQAVLEGVMMKSGDNCALSVRRDGKIITETQKVTSLRKKYKFFNIPIIRGVVNMIETFKLSYGTLGKSAEMLGIDDEPETKFEKWLKDKLGDNLMNVLMGIAGVLGVVLAVVLFKFVPMYLAKLVEYLLLRFADVQMSGAVFALIEGFTKIGIFIAYMALVSLMPDIRRTFEYHGAEHKSIACFESGLELTPENASTCTRFHPRCGTSFIFVILLISIILFIFLPITNMLARFGLQLLLLPLLVGLSFEFIMFAGRHDNLLTKIMSAPGLLMQRITTKEPDLEQLEVAIKSLKAAMPDEFPPEEEESENPDDTEASGESSTNAEDNSANAENTEE